MPGTVLVVGSVNMDFVVSVDHLPVPGETVLSPMDYAMIPGGKGANQACTVARLGTPVSMLGRVGNDFLGQALKDNLRKAGVQVDMVAEDSNHTSGVAFISVDTAGQNAIVVASGANGLLQTEHIEQIEGAEALFSQADYLLVQLEVPLETVTLALKKAKAAGATTILDPAPAVPLPADLLSQVDILTPNETEAFMLLEESPRQLSLEEAPAIARRLQQRGPRCVIVTCGDQGACLLDTDGAIHVIPGVCVETVDTTAAGDIFNGALVVALSEGRQLPDAVMFANHAAALSVTKRGAQTSIPSYSTVEQFIAVQAG